MAAEKEDKLSGSVKYIAGIVAACATIAGSVVAIDSRYAKPADIQLATIKLSRQIDDMQKKILEDEILRTQLGNNVKANEIMVQRYKDQIAELQRRLRGYDSEQRVLRSIRPTAAPAPIAIPHVVESPANDVTIDDAMSETPTHPADAPTATETPPQ